MSYMSRLFIVFFLFVFFLFVSGVLASGGEASPGRLLADGLVGLEVGGRVATN